MRQARRDKTKVTGDGDIGQAHRIADAPGTISQHFFERGESCVKFAALPVEPDLAALFFVVKACLVIACCHRIHGAVGESLPAPDFEARVGIRRDEARAGKFSIHIIRNQWRVDEHAPVVELKRRDFADRIDRLVVAGLPQIAHFNFVPDVFLDQHDADLAGKGAGGGSVKFQVETLLSDYVRLDGCFGTRFDLCTDSGAPSAGAADKGIRLSFKVRKTKLDLLCLIPGILYRRSRSRRS